MQSEHTNPTNPPAVAGRPAEGAVDPADELASLRGQRDAVKARLDEAQQTIATLERRNRIDALLREAQAIDVDAARLLTEHAVEAMDQPDVQAAVHDLRKAKPYLFARAHPPAAPAGSAMAPHVAEEAENPTALAAEQAAETGNRRDLLRYLRLRRGA